MPSKSNVKVTVNEFGRFSFQRRSSKIEESREKLIEKIPYAFPSESNNRSRFILSGTR